MLRPVHADLYLDYKCPHCSTINQVTLKEAKEIGKILCSCDKILILESFKANLQLDYITKDKPVPKVLEKPKGNTYKNGPAHINRSEVVEALFTLGWSKSEAKRIIVLEDDGKMDNEMLLQKCLKKQTV